MWEYNQCVMDHFGARYAALDVYNIFTTAAEVDDLMGLLAALPVGKLSEALYSGSANVGWLLKAKIALKTRDHWDTIYDLYKTKRLADELLAHYEDYPTEPGRLDRWQAERDAIMERVYEETGADSKY